MIFYLHSFLYILQHLKQVICYKNMFKFIQTQTIESRHNYVRIKSTILLYLDSKRFFYPNIVKRVIKPLPFI